MQKIEIIAADGKSTPISTGVNRMKVAQPGSVVKISVTKDAISGSQKDGNNLILVQKNGSKITIEDFFKTEGSLKNKLILEDGGKSYEAEYNAENFTGLAFFPVKQMNTESTDNGEVSTAVWLVPLLIVAGTGIGIAIHKNNKNDKNDKNEDNESSQPNVSSDNKEKQALDNAQKAAEGKGNELISAQNTLTEAIKAMQLNTSVSTIKKVEDASTVVKTAMDALNEASSKLMSAIASAKAKGIDTTQAEKVQTQADEGVSAAKNDLDSVGELVKTATVLSDESTQVVAEQAKQEYKFATDAATAANVQPNRDNINAAKAKLSSADATLVKLNIQIEKLTQLIVKAKEQGFNVDNATSFLKNLKEQQISFGKESNALAEYVAQAEQSLQNLDTVRKNVAAANEALKLATEQKSQAAEKLASAVAMKEYVVKNNQLDRVEDVNKAIIEANKNLELAFQAAEAANSLAAKANADIDKINSVVDPSEKPQKAELIDTSGLASIDKGLQIDDNKTFIESVQTFVKSLVHSVNGVWQTIVNSKSLEFLNKVISEITTGMKTVGEVLGEKVIHAVKAIKTVEKALVDVFINKPVDFFKDVIGITWQKVTQAVTESFSTIKSGFDAIVSGISKAISDAVKDMGLLDWLNPNKWVGLVTDVVVNSVSNVVKNIFDVMKTIPAKIIDFFADAIGKYAGAFTDKVKAELGVVKDVLSDVMKTLFDGFIKNPIDKLLSPVLEKITDFLSHPIESLQKLVSSIVDLVQDSLNIIKSIIDLPYKWVNDSIQLIKDIYNSFKGDNVKNGDGSELQKKIDGDNQSDTAKKVISLLKSDSSSGDINLSKLVPESSDSKSLSAVKDTFDSVVNYHTASVTEDINPSLPVAA